MATDIQSVTTSGDSINGGNESRTANGFNGKDLSLSPSKTNYGQSTRALHSGQPSSHWTHSPIMAPLYMTTTYETLDPGQAVYEYSRSNNPTRNELQDHLRALESAKYALAFSSGLAALTTISYLLEAGQHILCCDDVYGGTHRFFTRCSSRMGIETTFVDGCFVENWTNNFHVGRTKMVWIETPSNPTMKIVDVDKIVVAVKSLDSDCIIVVDNTFMTPIYFNPLKVGVDIVTHSCTKYINGHSDAILGCLMTNSDELYEKLKFFQNALGTVPSAFDCSQVTRSIKTLHVRVRQQTQSALEIAKFLEKHQNVERILYPGLKSHPQYELAAKQYSGFSGMMSVYVKTVKGDEAIKIVRAVKVFHTAVSLGCVCSLIEIPSLMTHAAVPEAERLKLGIHDNLVRLSIGLENVEDLINDLNQAFNAAY